MECRRREGSETPWFILESLFEMQPLGHENGESQAVPPGQAGSGGWGAPRDSGGGRNAAVGTEPSSRNSPPPQLCPGAAPAGLWRQLPRSGPHVPGGWTRSSARTLQPPLLGHASFLRPRGLRRGHLTLAGTQSSRAAEARALPCPPPSGLRDRFSPVPLPLLTEKRKLCV